MTRIKELEIRGIRNFGDEKGKGKIYIHKPLTLILGPNGTGKTTIIESLKYLTTGEYPPDSDKGKSFVHEPKLTSVPTVKGMVTGRLKNKLGTKQLTVSRAMQVTRLASGSIRFQGLDSMLKVKDNKNNVQSVTGRCADVNNELLKFMGVSKAILNYVIFCHQEESNWPLEDGKKLKDKFDEIFDTSLYNKAMDTTAKFVKELAQELKVLEAKRSGLKGMVEEIEGHEKTLKDTEEKKRENEERINEIGLEINPIILKQNEISSTINKYTNIQKELDSITTNYKIANDQIESLKLHIKNIFEGSEEELLKNINDFDEDLTKKAKQKIKLEQDLRSAKNKENILSNKLAETRIQLGGLKQKKNAFDEQVIKRNKLLVNALKVWEINEAKTEFTENEAKNYLKEITQKLQRFEENMKQNIENNEKEERHVQREVDECRVEKTGKESERTVKSKEKAHTRQEINQLRREISQTQEEADKLNKIESDLKHATEKYENLVKEFDEKSIKKNLQDKIDEKKEYEQKLKELDEEMTSLHRQSSQQAELEITQKAYADKEKEILKLQDKHKNDLKLLFEDKPLPQKRIKYELEKIQRKLSQEKSKLKEYIDREQRNLSSVKTTLKHQEKEINHLQAEQEAFREKIELKCQGNDYEEILRHQNIKVKTLQDKIGVCKNQIAIFNEYIESLNKEPCCPLCERNFQNANEGEKLKKKLLLEIKNNPDSLKKYEIQLKKEQKEYEALQNLRHYVEKIEEYEKEKLPKLRKEKSVSESKIETLNESINDYNMSLVEPEKKLEICESISGDMALWDNFSNELENLNEKINAQKYQLSKSGKIGDRNMQEVQNERKSYQEKITNLQEKIEKMQLSLQERQNEIMKARDIKSSFNEEVLKIRTNMQKLKQSKDKLTELMTKEEKLEESIQLLSEKLVTSISRLKSAEKELADLKTRYRKEQEKDREFKMENSATLKELQNIQQDVDIFIKSKTEDNLKKLQEELDKTNKENEKARDDIMELDREIRNLFDQVNSQEISRKELQNNMDLKEKEKLGKKLQAEINEYKKKLSGVKISSLEIQYGNLQEKKESLEQEQATLRGKKQECEATIQNLKYRVLVQDKYAQARKNFKQNQIKYIVQQQAMKNLNEYMRVLDKSMIQHHTERMGTVNKIMAKLWSSIYGGNDTNTIQIKVDETKLGDKRRSYNYKLVQLKRGIEMDMKGRCSAGQKVLASIIIRMALAETFCSNCAILALDEPTTNLDAEHAKNLAQTLSKVIQLRSRQHENFQLIVISHDEKFITSLLNICGNQTFQELYRNPEGLTMVRQRDKASCVSGSKNSQINDENSSDDSDADSDNEDNSNKFNSRKRAHVDDSPPPVSRRRRAN